jgi:hypothetical protein
VGGVLVGFVVGNDLVSGMVVGMVLVLATLPLLSRLTKQEDDIRVRRIIIWGFILKMLAAPAQLVVSVLFYGGISDFNIYHNVGASLSRQFRHGNFTADIGKVAGTGFIEIVTGLVYTVTGVTKLGGSFVFAWLGFLGLCCFYRAFTIGFPSGDRRRYALLLFLMPTLVFWSSAMGKDAWMVLTLGLAALGTARLLTRRRGGFVILALGLAGSAMVRPYVSLAWLLALAIGYVLRRSKGRSPFRLVAKVGGAAVLVVIGLVLASSVAGFFGIRNLSESSIQGQLNKNSAISTGTSVAGTATPNTGFSSSFSTTHARSPAHLPMTVITVMFRPLPYEAHSIPQFLASVEGAVLLGVSLASWRRIVASIRWARASPYVVVSLVYTAIFIYLFSSVGNLGVLSRQRVQVLPFFAVLLAVPLAKGPRKRKHGSRPGGIPAVEARAEDAASAVAGH